MAPSAIPVTNPETHKPTKSILPQDDTKHVHGRENLDSLAAISHGDVVLPPIPTFPTFETKRQWQLEHMAAAFRHWNREGYVEGISGHISVRDPEFHNAFWTNPLGRHFGLLKASDMILVDLDGNVIGGNRTKPPNAAGFMIHAAVHKARPDVHAVCHAHTTYGKAWSVFGKPLEMLTQDACKFWNAHTVYNSYGGTVLAREEGERIAEALGDAPNKACILRNHGLLTTGETVDEAAFLFLSFEHACQGQLLAEAAAANGLGKILITDEEAEYNYKMESTPEVCYHEFLAYYDYEEHMLKGELKG